MNLTIIDLAEVIASGAVILSFGVIAALLYKPTTETIRTAATDCDSFPPGFPTSDVAEAFGRGERSSPL